MVRVRVRVRVRLGLATGSNPSLLRSEAEQRLEGGERLGGPSGVEHQPARSSRAAR